MSKFRAGDKLRAINVDDCEEGLKLGQIVTATENQRPVFPYVIVQYADGRLRQLESARFERVVINKHGVVFASNKLHAVRFATVSGVFLRFIAHDGSVFSLPNGTASGPNLERTDPLTMFYYGERFDHIVAASVVQIPDEPK